MFEIMAKLVIYILTFKNAFFPTKQQCGIAPNYCAGMSHSDMYIPLLQLSDVAMLCFIHFPGCILAFWSQILITLDLNKDMSPSKVSEKY